MRDKALSDRVRGPLTDKSRMSVWMQLGIPLERRQVLFAWLDKAYRMFDDWLLLLEQINADPSVTLEEYTWMVFILGQHCEEIEKNWSDWRIERGVELSFPGRDESTELPGKRAIEI